MFCSDATILLFLVKRTDGDITYTIGPISFILNSFFSTIPSICRDRKLSEILHSRLKHLNIVLTGNILVEACADTLRMAHLTEYSAVG